MVRLGVRVCALALVSVAAVACGGSSSEVAAASNAVPALIRIDGSSTVFPISEAVARQFEKTNPNVRVTVEISGTGGGFQKFCRGETDISNASRPIRPREIENCRKAGIEYIELPIAYDGVAVVVNPKNTWATSVTVAELRTLWSPDAQETVQRWNQVRSSWPNREIRLFGAGIDSGTYDYFTEAVVGTEGVSRADFTSSEDDNVLVRGVSSDELALGFVPLAYVEQNPDKLKLVPVDDGKVENGSGPLSPSAETVRDGTYQPLSRPLFIYVAKKAAHRPEVQQFVDTYLSASSLIREAGYVELTPQLYDLARIHFAERKVGTVFGTGGSQVGLTLVQLLTREQ